jgi:predicted membrane protein
MKFLRFGPRFLRFWRKMRLDYRIIVRTEGELDAIVNVRLRPLNWFVLLSTVLVLGWLFFGALLLYTPLGGYMPGAANRDWQRQVVEQTRRLDSLEEVLQTSRSQWSVLRREWLGEDSLLYQDLPLPTVGQNYHPNGWADSLLRLEVEREFANRKAGR